MNIHTGCPTCGFQLWVPAARLRVSTVGLYDDARYPGRCIVSLNEHSDDVTDLDDYLRTAFFDDVMRVGRLLARLPDVERVNYAILGNAEPHVHAHVIPRRLLHDPAPGQSPWSTAQQKTRLDERERQALVGYLQSELAAALVG